MRNSRPFIFTLAGGPLILATLTYVSLVVLAIPNGRAYLAVLGGNTPMSLGTIVAIYGTLAVLALLLACEILTPSIGRTLTAGFTAWFGVTALSAILVAPPAAVGIGLTGLLPLVLVWYGIRATR